MATTTTKHGLTKPASTDFYDITEYNETLDKIDEFYSPTNKPTATDVGALPISGGTVTGQLRCEESVIVKTVEQIRTNYGIPIEIGKYIDMHQEGSTNDYDLRISIASDDSIGCMKNSGGWETIYTSGNKSLLTEAEKNLPLRNGYIINNICCYYKDADGIVHIQGSVMGTIDSTMRIIGDLPVGYRPSVYAYGSLVSYENQYTGIFTVRANGEIGIQVYNGTSDYAYFSAHFKAVN